jgi:ATP-dependent Clp protease adaptor protein ClpS
MLGGETRGGGTEATKPRCSGTCATMGAVATTAPVELEHIDVEDVTVPDVPWIVLVWNDPINLMSYVTFVFQKLFGYSREKAELLMLDVHQKGRAVVSSGTREEAEADVFRLHEHGLWATMEKDGTGRDGTG